jgi:peroxiredoxin
MSRISLNTPAPDFTLQNFQGETVRLSDFKGQADVLLVFNRTFT